MSSASSPSPSTAPTAVASRIPAPSLPPTDLPPYRGSVFAVYTALVDNGIAIHVLTSAQGGRYPTWIGGVIVLGALR